MECAAKEYLRRMFVIWTSPLFDHNRVTTSKQFAFPVLGYLMWTQQWPIMDIREIDRKAREMLHDLGLIDEVPPWYSPAKPKPVYESDDVQAYWDVPVFADHEEVRCNRVDARIVNHKTKRIVTLEISCPWVSNREKKNEEKTVKYAPLRWELKQQFPGYEVKQHSFFRGFFYCFAPFTSRYNRYTIY